MDEAKKAILCVDDEKLILIALIQELKNSFGTDYVYEKATDAYQAYKIIDDLVRDGIKIILIISDWLMPGIKGDEFLETVRSRHPGIQAVMITGQADSAVIERLLSTGCVTAVIEKPWDPQRLIEVVKRCGLEPKDSP